MVIIARWLQVLHIAFSYSAYSRWHVIGYRRQSASLWLVRHTHPFNGPFSGTTQVSQYQKGKTNLGFTAARDSEWQWHQLEHMQVCTLLQTDNHASTPPLSFLQAGCPSCRSTNSVKALKANRLYTWKWYRHTGTTVVSYVPIHTNHLASLWSMYN